MRGRPSEVLDALPRAARPLVLQVLRAADARDLRVYLVGGPVRDHLLGRVLRDVDLTVERRGGVGAPQLARAAATRGMRIVAHERFGTVTLEGRRAVLDLATCRSERYAHPGALPEVAAGSLEQDLLRRDFSVNALAIPLSRAARRAYAEVVDPTGGVADLARRRLRILHPRSFRDDPTRALRAARLGPRLGFRLSASSRRALARALAAGSVAQVSGERLRRELEKVFEEVALGLDPVRALELVRGWGVLRAIQSGLRLGDVARRDLRRLRASLDAPPWRWESLRPWVPGFALWLADVRAEPRRRTLERLALRGALATRIAEFPGWRARTRRTLRRAGSRGAVDREFRGLADEWLLSLHAGSPLLCRRRIERYAREDRGRPTPLSGDDLIRLGLSGPTLGDVLARLRAAYLDGRIGSREQALALVRELAGLSASPAADGDRAGGRGARGSVC